MLHLTGHSRQTICDYRKFFRQLVASSLDTDDTVVGGHDVIVEVDETKMGDLLMKVKENTIEGIMSKVLGYL